MKQLADRFDVATSTVSRALSGSPGSGEALSKEIRQVAVSLGYRPKPYRRKLSRTVGLLTGNDQSSFGAPVDAYQLDLMSAVMDVVGAADWHLHSEKLSTNEDTLPRLVLENRVDGLILCQHPPVALCEKIKEMGIPAVVLDDTPQRTGLPCVIANVTPATAQTVEQLSAMGHKNIAMVTTPKRYPTVQRRVEGFMQGLKAAGLDAKNPQIIHVGYSTLQQGQAATRQLLGSAGVPPVNPSGGVPARRDPPADLNNNNKAGRAGVSPAILNFPTAIIFATDRLAIGGLLEINSAGLSVPDDISIVGHDNTLLGQGCDPALTSIDLNMESYVTRAFEELQNIISGDLSDKRKYNPDSIEIPCKAIWRGSCGPGKRDAPSMQTTEGSYPVAPGSHTNPSVIDENINQAPGQDLAYSWEKGHTHKLN